MMCPVTAMNVLNWVLVLLTLVFTVGIGLFFIVIIRAIIGKY